MIRQPQTRDQRRLQAGESQRIFQQMRRFFAPASILPAPGSNPQQTSGRNTVLTAGNAFNSTPTDSTTLQLQGGQVIWYFKTRFNSPPNVTATAVTTDGTVRELTLAGAGTEIAAHILSTDPNDVRLVNLHAVGAPD